MTVKWNAKLGTICYPLLHIFDVVFLLSIVYPLPSPTPVQNWERDQRAKKVLSDSSGLVDFAIGLVNSVFNLPDGQVMFYEEFE